MSTNTTTTLKVTRRKAGLTQADLAHLMGLDSNRVSRIERGERLPSLPEAAALSVIYGRVLNELCADEITVAASDIAVRLQTLPTPKTHWISTFNRRHTLTALADRLADLDIDDYVIE